MCPFFAEHTPSEPRSVQKAISYQFIFADGNATQSELDLITYLTAVSDHQNRPLGISPALIPETSHV